MAEPVCPSPHGTGAPGNPSVCPLGCRAGWRARGSRRLEGTSARRKELPRQGFLSGSHGCCPWAALRRPELLTSEFWGRCCPERWGAQPAGLWAPKGASQGVLAVLVGYAGEAEPACWQGTGHGGRAWGPDQGDQNSHLRLPDGHHGDALGGRAGGQPLLPAEGRHRRSEGLAWGVWEARTRWGSSGRQGERGGWDWSLWGSWLLSVGANKARRAPSPPTGAPQSAVRFPDKAGCRGPAACRYGCPALVSLNRESGGVSHTGGHLTMDQSHPLPTEPPGACPHWLSNLCSRCLRISSSGESQNP